MHYKTAIGISIGLIVLSIFFTWHLYMCPLMFNLEISAGDVIAILMNFGVVAILIERFTNQIVIKPEFKAFMFSLQSSTPSFSLAGNNYTREAAETDFKKKFYWISFAIGVFIASIGFRYFHNVVELKSECNIVFWQPQLFAIADVFLSGILMSGGARFVLEIISWWKEGK